MDTENLELMASIRSHGLDVRVIRDWHWKVFSKFHKKWLNFYPSRRSFNFDNESISGMGLEQLIRFALMGDVDGDPKEIRL